MLKPKLNELTMENKYLLWYNHGKN